jgi:acetylornithine deacetylase/succinyl-diaminopimelate desuccinylase-like protein
MLGAMHRTSWLVALALACSACVRGAAAETPRADRVAFRALYKELVETNTTLSAGSCTLAAQRMAAHLTAAGYPDADVHVFTAPDHPNEGGLVAVLHAAGTAKARPILLLAHLDVVEARREDWTRDPFTLVEEGGYFYARGTSDDKAMAAIWIDALVRMRTDGFRPTRDIKLALTCGEETAGAFNGTDYLVQHQRAWIDAAFALNEGGGGNLDSDGHRVQIDLQVDQKLYQDFRVETTSPGGHSSQPYKPNAIDTLAAALVRIGDHEFPVRLTAVTRTYFTELAKIKGGSLGAAITTLLAHPEDAAADAIVSVDRGRHSMLHTTCASTMISGGHAVNALPQRATANVNCRIVPGTTVDDVRAELARVVADSSVTVTITPPESPVVPPTALDPAVIDPARALAKGMFPGVPMIPTMMTGASDGKYLTAAGIPTFGIDGAFGDPDNGNIHGLNERIRVQSLYEDRDYLERLVRIYAGAK